MVWCTKRSTHPQISMVKRIPNGIRLCFNTTSQHHIPNGIGFAIQHHIPNGIGLCVNNASQLGLFERHPKWDCLESILYGMQIPDGMGVFCDCTIWECHSIRKQKSIPKNHAIPSGVVFGSKGGHPHESGPPSQNGIGSMPKRNKRNFWVGRIAAYYDVFTTYLRPSCL